MKLRQKLAAVLATAMIVTAVPVVTMADSTNKIVKNTSVIEKNEMTTGVALRMKFDDADGSDEEFYFELTNAEWLTWEDATDSTDEDIIEKNNIFADCTYTLGSDEFKFQRVSDKKWELHKTSTITRTTTKVAEYIRQSKTVVRIVANGVQEGQTIVFPMPVKATGGSVSVAVKGEGGNSTITEGSYTFLSTGEKAASLTVGDLNSFYDNGELSPITLKETFLGSFGVKDMILKIQLEDTDFEFVKSSKVTIEGSYGFDFKYNTEDHASKVKFTVDADDKSVAYIVLDSSVGGSAKSLGRIKITGLKVDSDEKDLQVGDLIADITTVDKIEKDDVVLTSSLLAGDFDANDELVAGAKLDTTYSNVAVAKIANYGASIQMKDEKAIDIIAGRDEEVTFNVMETVDDVFVGSRTITLGLKDNEEKTDKSFFMITEDQKNDPIAKLLNNDASREVVESIEFIWKDEDDLKSKVVSGKETSYWVEKGIYRATGIKVTLKDTDKDGKHLNANDEIDKFQIKTKIYVPVSEQGKKSIEITGEVRGVDEFKSATAVNVIDPFNVEFDQTTLKVGLQNQAAGKIAIAETDKEMFMKGDLIMNITKGSKDDDGIIIEEKGDLTVTGDLKRTDFGDTDNNKADKVTLKRQSKAASTLTVENMEVTVDRTVPEGYYDIELRGEAIDEYDGKYTVEDYIVIGTPNTQDITSAGLAKGTSTFVIGESKYVMNNIEYTMDAPSYLQDPGYTMVPVRYVAQAFGVESKDILFGKGTVTIFAGERTVSLTNGSNVAVVNGNQVAMGTAVVIKDGRTYAPAGEIARLLGIQTAWDSATKTATFTN